MEARGGSTLDLSGCNVSGCGKSGVFVQAFSRAKLSRCRIIGNHFAGVEAMRYGKQRHYYLDGKKAGLTVTFVLVNRLQLWSVREVAANHVCTNVADKINTIGIR